MLDKPDCVLEVAQLKDSVYVEIMPGFNIHDVFAWAWNYSSSEKVKVEFVFNDILVSVDGRR
jgi:hypothetical protein